MIAIDTNVLLRYIVKDDPRQEKTAVELLTKEDCLLLPGVILETVWVLESGYHYSTAQVVERLKHVFGLPTVLVEGYPAMIAALEWYAAGMDFADAQHTTFSEYFKAESFATFDKGIANAATRLGIQHPIRLLRGV